MLIEVFWSSWHIMTQIVLYQKKGRTYGQEVKLEGGRGSWFIALDGHWLCQGKRGGAWGGAGVESSRLICHLTPLSILLFIVLLVHSIWNVTYIRCDDGIKYFAEARRESRFIWKKKTIMDDLFDSPPCLLHILSPHWSTSITLKKILKNIKGPIS